MLPAAALVLLPSAGLEAQSDGRPPSPALSPAPWAAPSPRFGAIAFTADGSFSSAWKYPSKAKVEAKVLADCMKFKRGQCEVVSFHEGLCAAIASFGAGKEHKVTYAGAALTRADARRSALERCNGDPRSRKECKLPTVVCGDGR